MENLKFVDKVMILFDVERASKLMGIKRTYSCVLLALLTHAGFVETKVPGWLLGLIAYVALLIISSLINDWFIAPRRIKAFKEHRARLTAEREKRRKIDEELQWLTLEEKRAEQRRREEAFAKSPRLGAM